MNFNPMDLIKIKETFYKNDSIPYNHISEFIALLLDIQAKYINLKYITIKEFGTDNGYWDKFDKKQEMIELAYKIKNLEDD